MPVPWSLGFFFAIGTPLSQTFLVKEIPLEHCTVVEQETAPCIFGDLLRSGALYIAYILTYLFNGWLLNQLTPILIFTGVFIAGYAVIWLIIYLVEKAKAEKLNKLLKG